MTSAEHNRAELFAYVATIPDGESVPFYFFHLNPESKGLRDRFAVLWLEADGSMTPIWGGCEGDKPTAKERKAWLPYMVYSPRPSSGPDRWPAFHFMLDGGNYSKQRELAEAIANTIGRPVKYCTLRGYATHWSDVQPSKAAAAA